MEDAVGETDAEQGPDRMHIGLDRAHRARQHALEGDLLGEYPAGQTALRRFAAALGNADVEGVFGLRQRIGRAESDNQRNGARRYAENDGCTFRGR